MPRHVFRTELCDHTFMTGAEFLRKLSRLAKARGRYGRVFLGVAFTALKDPKQELGFGLLNKMCRDLGIKPRDL